MKNAKHELHNKLVIDDGPLKYMLGIHVEREQHTKDMSIHEPKFIQDNLRKI